MTYNTATNRRRFLRNLTVVSSVGLAGCIGGGGSDEDDVQDSDGDGVIDSQDYAPNDPEVQEKPPTETDTPIPETREKLNQPACTGDHTFKIVEAEYGDFFTLAFENIGNEAAYSVSIIVNHGGESNRIVTSGISRAGTRFELDEIDIPGGVVRSLEDVTIEINANLGSEYGELVQERPCV